MIRKGVLGVMGEAILTIVGLFHQTSMHRSNPRRFHRQNAREILNLTLNTEWNKKKVKRDLDGSSYVQISDGEREG